MELRHWTQADAMELTSLCNAVDRRFLSDRQPNPYTKKDAEEWLKTVSENEAVTGIYRAIVYDRKLIGSISVEKKDDDAEIGYMLHNDYSNKGIGTKAVKQICLIAFKYKSAIPNAVIKDGNVYDLLIYVLTEETR